MGQTNLPAPPLNPRAKYYEERIDRVCEKMNTRPRVKSPKEEEFNKKYEEPKKWYQKTWLELLRRTP